MHGPYHSNVERSYLGKRHRDVKRRRDSGYTSKDSSSGKNTIEELSSDDTRSSVHKKKKNKRCSQSSLIEEFKNKNPSTFDGEINKGEEFEVWLLGLRKYFQVHINYLENKKAKI
jgi:hypothetical protein